MLIKYINKAWLKIYCKQMRDFPENKKPSLLLVVKDNEERRKVYNLLQQVKIEVFKESAGEASLSCSILTENDVKEWAKRTLPIRGFTNFLISHDVNNCLLINYLCKIMEVN